MNPNARKFLLGGLLLVGVGACTDVTLEPKSAISSTNVFNEPAAYKQFLAKLYGGLVLTGQSGPFGNSDLTTNDEGFSQYMRLYWQMQELPTEEAAIAWGDGALQELNTQTWGATNPFLTSMYYRVFFQASMVNEFLRETSDAKLASRGVSGTLATEIKQYRAEARFLRALSYWHGIDLFGDIPLVKETDPIGKVAPQQAKRADIFAYVTSELLAIRNELPPAGGAQYGRADQGAVAMLLAKLYLNAQVYTGTARYSEARAEAERVIAGSYVLDPNFRRIFSADNHTSPELVFALPQDGKKSQNYGAMTTFVHASVGGDMSAAEYGINGGWWGLRLKPQVLSWFPGNGGPTTPDKRSEHFFFQNQSVAMNELTNFQQGIAAPKFSNKTSTGAAGSDGEFVDTDYPMFRLGDAYLIYAEAVVRGGGGTRVLALDYINRLRRRAYGNNSGDITDAQMTVDFMLDERGRELLWEGTRRQDLIRYGRFTTVGVWAWKGNVVAGRVTDAKYNLFPLPASELLANPNLKQNTGY
ncbi:MAG: RagB/SusD family nutrient uptake outer membrane protein [Gemmatimonas sp.]